MPWIFALVGLVAGIIIGLVISRLKTPDYKKHKVMQKSLDAAKFELEQKRQEVAAHFSETVELLDILGKDYTRLYQHMELTSSDLLSHLPDQDNPFFKKTTENKNKSTTTNKKRSSGDQAPKDYANGATGLLTEPEKPFVQSAEVVTLR